MSDARRTFDGQARWHMPCSRPRMDLGKRVERHVKRAVFGLIAGRRTPAATSVDLRRVRRVLLVRSNFRMGNLLLITPALAAIRAALPRARVDLVCAAGYAPLLAHDPDVDEVIPVDRRMLLRPASLARVVGHLRRQRYDLVIDCARGASFIGAFLCGVSGGRQRVATAGSRYQAFFDVLVPRSGRSVHKTELLLEFLAAIGILPVRRTMRVALTENEEGIAAARWHAWGLSRGTTVVGVSVGARGRKRWSADRFVRLVETIVRDLEARVVVFAGPEDGAVLDAIRGRLPHGAIICPPVAVRDFAALLARCTVVVTPDSGPMHLAAAVGTPTVTIVRSPSAAYYRPEGEMHAQVRAGDGPDGDEVPIVVALVDARLPRRAAREATRAYG